MKLFNTLKIILMEEFSEERKQRIFDKIVNILTNSLYVREKGNKLVFWYISDQLNEPVLEYNKRTNTLSVLKGKVKSNILDVYLPTIIGQTFRTSVLTKVFRNLTSSLLKLDRVDFQDN